MPQCRLESNLLFGKMQGSETVKEMETDFDKLIKAGELLCFVVLEQFSENCGTF